MIWVNLGALACIGLIVWWFWLSKPKAVSASRQQIEILVDNGVYTPSRIEIRAGEPVTLRFLRQDPSPCAEKVVFTELGVTADLPLNRPLNLTVTAPKVGAYSFTCQMQMYRGELVAR